MQNFQGACSWLELLCVGTSQATAGFGVRLHFLSSVCSSFLLPLADGKVTCALSRHPKASCRVTNLPAVKCFSFGILYQLYNGQYHWVQQIYDVHV